MTTRRISKSLLDPYLIPLVPRLYALISPPRALPPEVIVAIGHVMALLGAIGFASASHSPLGGAFGALCVALNHLADMIDGTHARRTGQCRNGGELLDHFSDPLSFTWWMVGIGIAAGAPYVAMVAVIAVLAMAVLTNIQAKLTGEFVLSRVGPTELKALLVLFGLSMATVRAASIVDAPTATLIARGFLGTLAALGMLALATRLVRSVRQVNALGRTPDTSEWEIGQRAA